MSNNQWLIQVETNHPQFINEFNTKWVNVVTDTLTQLTRGPKPTEQIDALRGLMKFSRVHFPYIKNKKQVESVAEKIRKEFTVNINMDIFDDYRTSFPLIFKEKKEEANNQKQAVKVSDFISKNRKNVTHSFNITTTNNSLDLNIVDLSYEQTKFMYNHIVDGIDLLNSVCATV